jgi:hypothetical protein
MCVNTLHKGDSDEDNNNNNEIVTMLLAKEETVLHGIVDKLIETGRCCGMQMNVEKTKVIRNARQPFPVKLMIYKNQLESVKFFKYLGSMLTDDGRCTCEIKSRIAMEKLHLTSRGLFLLAKWTSN